MDLDCYFVSAERCRYPFLKGKNVVVAKSSDTKIFSHKKKSAHLLDDSGAFNSILEFENGYNPNILRAWRDEFVDANGNIHGIVIAKSYEAKSYGIQTGTYLRDALMMCKDLIVIPSDHLYYQQISTKLKRYLEKKIPLIEQYSIDEFFGDLNGWIKDEDTESFIKELQADILDKFDLPITIGASKSKWIAKLLTDRIKPYGTKALPQDEVKEYVADISIDEFAGIGRKISQKLKSYHIYDIKELIARSSILNQYGKTGKDLLKRVQGIDNEAVIPNQDRRAIGISRNFHPISSRDEVYRRAVILARYLSYTITKLGLNPTSYYFKIKYEYGVKNSLRQTHLRLFNEKFLVDLALKSIKELDIHYGYKVKYISINASNFTNSDKTYSLLHHSSDMKYAKLNNNLLSIRDKFGIDIIKYANEV
jgi:DNA polymerase-4